MTTEYDRDHHYLFFRKKLELCDFDKSQKNENFHSQEELELIGEGDDEGWVRARNYKGEVNMTKIITF